MKITIPIITVLLLLPLALGMTKPIAGEVSQSADVTVFVKVDSPVGEICKTEPAVQTGPDGSFATNLGNLVYLDSPSTPCSGIWKAGDEMWFSANDINSDSTEIKLGTGLQRLGLLTIPSSSPPSSGGGSASLSGPTTTIILDLSLEEFENAFKSTIDVSGINSKITLKLIIMGIPNDNIVRIIEDSFSQDGVTEYIISKTDLTPGRYSIQALAYSGSTTVASSAVEEFFIQPSGTKVSTPQPPQPIEDIPIERIRHPVTLHASPFMPFIYSISFVLLLIAAILYLGRR